LNIETLEKALKQNPKAKALIVQHTLGYPADIEAIASWCKKNKLVLIEDLAHSAFGQLEDGRLLGSFGDAIAFSFGRDKVIDSISGGAVCFKKDVELSALKQQPNY